MAQLTRKLFQIFCGNKEQTPTDNIGVFGSKKAGSSAWNSDPDVIQTNQYLNGWSDAVINNQAPCMDDMNAVMFVFSYMLKYVYQSGIPGWLPTEDYYQYSLVQYNGYLWMSTTTISGDVSNPSPDSSSSWKRLVFTTPWIAGATYNTGDTVNYEGKTFKCVATHTANSMFETDYYGAKWDDGNPVGTMVHNIAWQKTTIPYHYFDVTGADAGRELSQATYGALYSIIGDYYNNCRDYTTNTNYPTPSVGNFRLPDFRNTFFKNSGVRDWGNGHNASHSHGHNYTSSRSLNHSHGYGGRMGVNVNGTGAFEGLQVNAASPLVVYAIASSSYKVISTDTQTTSMSIPALNLQTQGSGSTPEPNYYGTRILLKY